MQTLWDKVKKNISEWYGVAYDKTDELAKIGKKKLEIAGINRAIEKHMTELGGKVYDLIAVQNKIEDIAKDQRVKDLIDEIKKLEEHLKLKESEIEAIKREKREKGEVQQDQQ